MSDRSDTSYAIMVDDVVKHYRTPGRGVVHALDGVSLRVEPGQVLGIVGESGCGKSTLARLLTGLERPTAGSVTVAGVRTDGRHNDRRRLSRLVQLVFQDPYASLDPRQRIGTALREVLQVHQLPAGPGPVAELLAMVGLVADTADRFPHQLSGGQCQRVGIARALAVQPQVLALDEPVSALDVSVRAEIMNLLVRLRAELGLTYVFISHDLGMVRHLADKIAVMYLGRVVEYGDWSQVADHATHPYTKALLAAEPTVELAGPTADQDRAGRAVPGEAPDAAAPPSGCRFHPRCPIAEVRCQTADPALVPIGPADEDHVVACPVALRAGRRD